MTTPTASCMTVVTAPANRPVPDIRCWLVSSLTALVNAKPGSSTTSEAMITVFWFSGATRLGGEAT